MKAWVKLYLLVQWNGRPTSNVTFTKMGRDIKHLTKHTRSRTFTHLTRDIIDGDQYWTGWPPRKTIRSHDLTTKSRRTERLAHTSRPYDNKKSQKACGDSVKRCITGIKILKRSFQLQCSNVVWKCSSSGLPTSINFSIIILNLILYIMCFVCFLLDIVCVVVVFVDGATL